MPSLRSLARVAAEVIEGSRYLKEQAEPAPPPPQAFAAFGEHSQLFAPCTVSGAERISVGNDVVIGELGVLFALDGGRIDIADHVLLERAVYIASAASVVIGPDVRVAGSVSIVDCWYHPSLVDGHGAWPPPTDPMPPPERVVIEEGTRIGTGAIIMPGTTIGAGAQIRAGAVVYDDVPAGAVAHGNPAAIMEGDQRG